MNNFGAGGFTQEYRRQWMNLARHGDEAGYQYHRKMLKEPACDLCLKAHKNYNTERNYRLQVKEIRNKFGVKRVQTSI